MNKLLKKTITLFLIFVICLSCFYACQNKSVGKLAPEIWSAPTTQKVLRSGYDDKYVKGKAEVNIFTAKEEYEYAQLILTANDQDVTFDFTVNDLENESGDVYEKENITLYVQKYIRISVNYDGNGEPTGEYPDALLPFETSKDYGENVINANERQGIYVLFYVDDVPSGKYTGSLDVILNGATTIVPVTLDVSDIVVGNTVSSRSHFSNAWSFEHGELDATQEMFTKYNKALLDYRLSPGALVLGNGHTDAEIKEYADLAYEFASNPKCTTVSLPYRNITKDGYPTFDEELMSKYIRAVAEKSIEKKYNIFEEMVVFFGQIIDEFDRFGSVDHAAYVMDRFGEFLNEQAQKVWELPCDDSTFLEELSQSISNIPHVSTSPYIESLGDKHVTWCPLVSEYNLKSHRDNYIYQSERWWYTCITPRTPFPTYHIEDSLLSARLLSWMQAQYNVVGNLFWAADIYGAYDGSQYMPIDDYYQYATRYPAVNGDGFLFYPGKQYGIDGPVPSIRLFAIRDGLEEYEILMSMKNEYENLSQKADTTISGNSIMEMLTGSLFSGTIVIGTDELLFNARKNLFALAEMAQLGVAFQEFSDDGHGRMIFKVFVENGTTLKINDELVTGGIKTSGGKIYEYIATLGVGGNKVVFSAEKNGKINEYSYALMSDCNIYTAEDLVADIQNEEAEVSAQIVDVPSEWGMGAQAIKIDMESTILTSQNFRLNSELFRKADSTVGKMYINIYNPSDNALQFSIYVKKEKVMLYSELVTYTLQPGLNAVPVDQIGSNNFVTSGKIEYGVFYFGEGNNQPSRTVYLQDIVVYYK